MISNLNILDIILVIIVAVSILFGLIKGFIRELFSLAFFIIAVVLAFLFYHDVGSLLMPHTKNRDIPNFVGFITIFTLVLIVGAVVTFVIKKIFTLGPLKAIDVILGGVFGLLRGILIGCIIVFALIVFPVKDNLLTKSQLTPYILNTIELFVHFLPAKYQEKINNIKTG